MRAHPTHESSSHARGIASRAVSIGLGVALAAAVGCGDGSGERSATRDATAGTEDTRSVLVCLGDSLTAGSGLDPDQAWPALLQQRIDDAGLPWQVRNAGISGDTTAGGLRRLDWALKAGADALILALGGNDGLRGIDPDVTRANLEAMIAAARARNPAMRIVIAGMKSPPNMGRAFTDAFEQVFRDVAEKEDVALIPFLLEGVAGIRRLNQADGIHPTAQGQEIVAANVWAVLEDVLDR